MESWLIKPNIKVNIFSNFTFNQINVETTQKQYILNIQKMNTFIEHFTAEINPYWRIKSLV